MKLLRLSKDLNRVTKMLLATVIMRVAMKKKKTNSTTILMRKSRIIKNWFWNQDSSDVSTI